MARVTKSVLNTQNTVGYTSNIACTAHTSHVNEEYP